MEAVGEAVLELLQTGDGSLAALDVPELEPLDGVVMVSEVGTPLDLEAFDDDDAVGPFPPAADDRLVGRLDEHPFLDPTTSTTTPGTSTRRSSRVLHRRRGPGLTGQYDRPGCGWLTTRRRSITWRVPSRNSRTRASSQPENSAWIASCAAAVNRSTFDGNRSGAYS